MGFVRAMKATSFDDNKAIKDQLINNQMNELFFNNIYTYTNTTEYIIYIHRIYLIV